MKKVNKCIKEIYEKAGIFGHVKHVDIYLISVEMVVYDIGVSKNRGYREVDFW